jgi:hypothetical protein
VLCLLYESLYGNRRFIGEKCEVTLKRQEMAGKFIPTATKGKVVPVLN